MTIYTASSTINSQQPHNIMSNEVVSRIPESEHAYRLLYLSEASVNAKEVLKGSEMS
jgi:hypothetical protein